jgi:hypothetical protein
LNSNPQKQKQMDLIAKLNAIQHDLKAPKSNFNSFGKYKYRSIEDIQEAVKPHLKKHGCVLNFSDEVVEVAGRVVIQATACIQDGKDDLSVTAYAEVDQIKGMNMAQAFGSASSYARKYAAGGLLLLDDTKDADGTNDHGKAPKKENDFEKALTWLTANPTQNNYDKLAVKMGSVFTDDEFKKLQAIVELAEKMNK